MLHPALTRVRPQATKALRRAAAFLPPSLRQPPAYWEWRRFLNEAQWWPAEKIRDWQLGKLREIVRVACTQTEGYRELYRKAGVEPEDIRCLEDIRHLPCVSKETFRDHLSSFTVPNQSGGYVTTGGSTGLPFGFYETRATTKMEQAFMHTGWSWVGWRLGKSSGVLRGGYVGSEASCCDYDGFHRELALSSYFLTSRTVEAYLHALRERQIRVLQAYPSSLNLLCDLVRDQKLDGRLDLDLILLGSENVYDWQVEKFAKTFPRTKLFAWYGHCEKAVLAPWCDQARVYHSWPFYGITEVLGDGDRDVGEGEEGEIVGTSFHQQITPFIRYRTMDRAVRGPAQCAACGRQFPLLSRLSGRQQEVIVTRTGRYISMTAINMHDDIFDCLRQFQFRQERPGEVVFHYVSKGGPLPAAELAKIERGLAAKLGSDVTLASQQVPEIPRTRSGKYRFLDQRLPIRYGDKDP